MNSMNIHKEIEARSFKLSTLKSIYHIAKNNPIMSLGMPEKIDRLEKELELLKEKAKDLREPRVELLFSGKAVADSSGIKASFLGEVVGSFQKIVKYAWAIYRKYSIGSRGRIKIDSDAELYVTALPTGSFGVELESLRPEELFAGEEMGEVLYDLARKIDEMLSTEDGLEAISDLPPRMASELATFLGKISAQESFLSVTTGGFHKQYQYNTVKMRHKMLTESIQKREEITVTGRVTGLSLNFWTIEIQSDDGYVYSLALKDEMKDDNGKKIGDMFKKRCKVVMSWETVITNKNTKETYELISIEEIDEDKAGD